MKRKLKLFRKSAFSKLSKGAVFCLSLSILSLIFGLVINRVLAVNWVGPSENPPNGNVEPPINTSNVSQEKKGGLNIATESGRMGIGLTNPGYKLDVVGTVHATGAVTFDSNLSAGNTNLKYLCLTTGTGCLAGGSLLLYNTGDTRMVGSLSVGGGSSWNDFVIDSTDHNVKIYADHSSGVLNIGDLSSTEKSAIVAKNNSDEVANIYAENAVGWGIYSKGTSGIYGEGTSEVGLSGKGVTYGVVGSTTDGIGVYGSTNRGVAAVYGVNNSILSHTAGVHGHGFTGILGSDKDQVAISSPVSTVAGRFIGAVTIENGTNPGNLTVAGNLVVDSTDNTLYVNSTSNRVGIGTAAPAVKLEVVAGSGQSGIYSYTGSIGGQATPDGPIVTVAGVYGKSGNSTSGWNYGIYGAAGTPSGTGVTIGVAGSSANAGSNTYAGYFRGPVEIATNGSVLGTLSVASTLTVGNSLTVSSGGASITGATSLIGDATISGDLINAGGLQVVGDDSHRSCDTFPDQYDLGTLFICKWCEEPKFYHRALYVYLDNETWVLIQDNSYSGDSCPVGIPPP